MKDYDVIDSMTEFRSLLESVNSAQRRLYDFAKLGRAQLGSVDRLNALDNWAGYYLVQAILEEGNSLTNQSEECRLALLGLAKTIQSKLGPITRTPVSLGVI